MKFFTSTPIVVVGDAPWGVVASQVASESTWNIPHPYDAPATSAVVSESKPGPQSSKSMASIGAPPEPSLTWFPSLEGSTCMLQCQRHRDLGSGFPLNALTGC